MPQLVDLVDAVHAGATAQPFPRTADTTAHDELLAVCRRAQADNRDDRAAYRDVADWLDGYGAGLGLDAVVPVDWERTSARFPAEGGTYVLVLEVVVPGSVMVGCTGRIGRMDVLPGYYTYVGSACSSAGLRGRLRWHLTPARDLRLLWHVDFLRLRCSVAEVWFTASPLPGKPIARECAWAACVRGMRGSSEPVPGFGSSDQACLCRPAQAHLAHSETRPSFRTFAARLRRTPQAGHAKRVVLNAR